MVNLFSFIFKPKHKPIQEALSERYGKFYDVNDYMDKITCLYKLGRRVSCKPARIMFYADAYPLRVYDNTLPEYVRN